MMTARILHRACLSVYAYILCLYSMEVFFFVENHLMISFVYELKHLQVAWKKSALSPVERTLLFVPHMKQLRNHFQNAFGWLRDAAPVFRLGVASLKDFLFGTFFKSFIQSPKALSRSRGSFASQIIIALRYAVPASVLIHDHRVLVGVLLQNVYVRLDQTQKIQFFRKGEVGGAGLANHAVCHEDGRHLAVRLVSKLQSPLLLLSPVLCIGLILEDTHLCERSACLG